MLKIVTSTSSQEFPCLATYLFYSSCFPELPAMLVLLIIIYTPPTFVYKILLPINGLLYIQFININRTAWGHGQVIEMCSRVIFYISCVEREPHISQDYL